MVVVATLRRPGLDHFGLPARPGKSIHPPPAVIDEELAVASPVWRLDVPARVVDDAPIFGTDGDRLKRAFQNRGGPGFGEIRGDLDLAEHRRFQRPVVVRTPP